MRHFRSVDEGWWRPVQLSSTHAGSEVAALVDDLSSLTGSLIEIYVFHADRATWRAALRVLSREAEGLELVVDGRLLEATQWDEVDFNSDSVRQLRAFVGGVEWTSTLFREDQVDLQLDPDDFLEGDALSRLLEILREIAEATGRTALLMPETAHPEDQRPLAIARLSV